MHFSGEIIPAADKWCLVVSKFSDHLPLFQVEELETRRKAYRDERILEYTDAEETNGIR